MHISPRSLLRDLRTNLKPGELFYWSVGNLIYWCFHIGMRVESYGVSEDYGPQAPATLILSAHKRDWDPIMCAAYSYYHRGWLAPDSSRRFAFAARADIWEPGFLAVVIGYKNWPLWMQWLLDRVNFAPIANRLRAYPISRIPEYTLREYLRSVLKEEGNLPLTDVLSEETIRSLARLDERLSRKRGGGRPSAGQRPQHISDILGWNYRPLTSRRIHNGELIAGRYEQLRERLRSLVDQQLETLARTMDSGETLWFAPEGAVTLDGRVMRLRGGLHILLARARPDARVLPSTITYDFMSDRPRMIACLAVGPELTGLRDLDRPELSQRVASALARQITVTMSQLGSTRLLTHLDEQRLSFQPEKELPILAAEARRLAGLGAWVQRDLLTERGLRSRLRAFLAYAVRQRLLSPQDDGSYLIDANRLQSLRGSAFWENPVRYCATELKALEEALIAGRQPAPEPAIEQPTEESAIS